MGDHRRFSWELFSLEGILEEELAVEQEVRRGWWRPGLKMPWLLGSVGDLDSDKVAEESLIKTHANTPYSVKTIRMIDERAVGKNSKHTILGIYRKENQR
jgi:hypothetical protein